MARLNLAEVTAEVAERALDLCICGAVPHEKYEPHCLHCGMYFEDCEAGLWEDDWEID